MPDALNLNNHPNDRDEHTADPASAAERPPPRAGKIFLRDDDRATIREHLETAYVALNQAFRGIWIEQALEHGWAREYWDEHDIHQLQTLALSANEATHRAWHALTAAIDAHPDQQQTAQQDSDSTGDAE